jgi:hypothetical protein
MRCLSTWRTTHYLETHPAHESTRLEGKNIIVMNPLLSLSSSAASCSQADRHVILDHARRCWLAFEAGESVLPGELLGSSRTKIASLDFKSDFEQFRAWAKNLGVFATDTASVDYRLRDAPDVRKNICSLLDALREDISQCKSAVVGQNDRR